MVVDLIEGAGAQAEGQAAEGVLDVAGAVDGDELIAQDGVALLGIDAQHQGGEAVDLLQAGHQLVDLGNGAAVDDQAHQNLPRHSTTADVDVAQEALAGGLVVNGDLVLVDVFHHRVLDLIGLGGEDQTAVVFHNLMGARPEETGVGLLLAGHGVLCLVAVAVDVGGGQDGHFLQIFAADAVQAVLHTLGLQAGFFLVIHVPEGAAAAELGHGALPVDTMGGLFQNFHDLACGPGLPGQLDADVVFLPGDGVGDEDGTAFDMGHALAFGGVVGDDGLVNLILVQHNFISM